MRAAVVPAILVLALSGGALPARGQEGSPSGAPAKEPAVPSRLGDVRIDVAVDRKTVTIGDPITVTVRLVRPPGVKVTSFEPERHLEDLALLERVGPGTKTLPDGRIEETRVLRVTRYQTGASRVPPFEAAFVDASGREGKVATPPVAFSVGSILVEGDTQPADIKSPAVMPVRPLWPWIVGLAVAAAAAAAWLWRRRRARQAGPAAAAPPAPPRPAHEIAYAELERLLSSGLLESGRVKPFYIELAEILKRYFEARFGIDTFERTTTEILEALRLARLPLRALTLSGDLYGACDLVKFARVVPPAEETRATVERAYRLIDETRLPEAASGPAGAPAATGGTGAGGLATGGAAAGGAAAGGAG